MSSFIVPSTPVKSVVVGGNSGGGTAATTTTSSSSGVGKLMKLFMIFVIMVGIISICLLHNYHYHHEEAQEMLLLFDDSTPPDTPTTSTNTRKHTSTSPSTSISSNNNDTHKLLYRQKVTESLRLKQQQLEYKQEFLQKQTLIRKQRQKQGFFPGQKQRQKLQSLSQSKQKNNNNTDTDTDTTIAMKRQRYRTLRKQQQQQPQSQQQQQQQQQMNIILFYADDWTMKVLGKLDPHKIVQTPNIDEMANNGMLFTNNCVTTSVCWASRSTLATGTYLGVHKHTMPFDEAKFETKHWKETLYPKMKSFRNGGGNYYTGLFGKWHKLEVGKELEQAFHERQVYYGHHWEDRNGQMRHVTDLNQEDSIQFLEKWHTKFNVGSSPTQQQKPPPRQPFFLTTAFFATHARDGELPSYQPKNETRRAMYPDWPASKNVPTPPTATERHYTELPPFLGRQSNNEGRTRWINRFEPKDFQTNIKDMYSMATEVDAAIGDIIAYTKSIGVYNNTMLIFTTDNGNLHGEHGLAEKWYPFEESIRVPLVIQDPRMPKHRRGTISDAWTLNVDLAPTILGAANIEPASFMQGRDISDLYLLQEEEEGQRLPPQQEERKLSQSSPSVGVLFSNDEMKKKMKWRHDWFYEFNLGTQKDGLDHPWKMYIDASFALVTDEWKYVQWPQHDGYEQLFHRSMDPYDEWDLLNTLLRNRTNTLWSKNNSNGGGIGGGEVNIQTTKKIYDRMKKRFQIVKDRAQDGKLI